MKSELVKNISDLNEEEVINQVRRELDAGTDPMAILDECRDGMVLVGEKYENGEYFVSDLMMAGETFRQVSKILAPAFKTAGAPAQEVVIIGTVKGDIHDIGKNLVVGMLQAANYGVKDLGVDVPAQRFVEAVQTTGAKVLALSGLLTLAYDSMMETVSSLDSAGLRPMVKVMIGGGPITENVCKYSGADGWGSNPQAAVRYCNEWIGG
jgi:methanogenic corrinoid protein MtbC1